MTIRVLVAMFVPMSALASPAVRAQHETDIWVGQSAGQVTWSPAGFVAGSTYNPLFRVDTFLHGWSNNDPGFDRATVTAGDVAPLTGPVQIYLQVMALDPALIVLGPNLSFVLDSAGDRGLLGGADLHTHMTWFVDETDPKFGLEPDKCVWEGTFRFIDSTGRLGPSAPFTLLFAIVDVRGGDFPPTDTPASGDHDEDNDMDGDDLTAFVVCVNGPFRRPTPADPSVTTCEVDCYNAFDFDDDMDVDLTDFAAFQTEYDP